MTFILSVGILWATGNQIDNLIKFNMKMYVISCNKII